MYKLHTSAYWHEGNDNHYYAVHLEAENKIFDYNILLHKTKSEKIQAETTQE